MHSATPSVSGRLRTGDGIELAYIRAGPSHGRNLLFLSGWRQSAAAWTKQIDAFAQAGFHVTAFDYRGHGNSEKPSFGYTIARFGADLKEVLTQLNLRDVSIVAHSMGSSVTWSFWANFPEERNRIERLAFIDQSTVLVQNPTWTQTEKQTYSAALFSPTHVYQFCANLSQELTPFIKSMFTSALSDEDFAWFLAENKKMSDENAGALLIDHAFADWRTTIPGVTVPVLVVAGEQSLNNALGIAWAATQMPNARQRTFSVEEKGSHFMFWENPDLFNSVLEDFLVKG